MHKKLSVLLVSMLLVSMPAAVGVYAADAPFAEIDKANIFLKDFEKEVERANGASNTRFFNKQEALTRIKRLNEQYPDDPRVKDMMKRASIALQKSMGGFHEITPDMLAYKNNEKQLQERYRDLNRSKWEEAIRSRQAITKAFPSPDPEAEGATDIIGKYVVLENVQYPTNHFLGATGTYLYVGKPSTGFYYLSMDGRNWAGAYEAIRRYRSLVDSTLGDNLTLSVLGKVTEPVMESPDPSAEKKGNFHWGWVVEPEIIYAGERVAAVYDPSNDKSGYFYGEDEVEKIKDSWYTVKSIPDNVDPKRLMEIFATAIKEKNYKLYLDCIYPARRKTDIGTSLLGYHWDLHQYRFDEEYVYVEFDEPKITVLKGFDDNNDLDNYFLNPEQREQITKMSGEKEEMAIVLSRAFDKNGKQVGSKNRHELRRKGNGRWYVNTYDVRF